MRLTPQQENLALVGGAALAAFGALVAMWPTSARERVVEIATSQLGSQDPGPYWKDTLPAGYPPSGYPPDWCGAFALWCLHQAGLGKDLGWIIEIGFLRFLPMTQHPLPGDIAYFDKSQHHALVTDLLPGDRVGLINGNGVGGRVTASSTARSSAQAYYSIAPLVQKAESQSAAPWLLSSAVIAGAGAWVLLPSR